MTEDSILKNLKKPEFWAMKICTEEKKYHIDILALSWVVGLFYQKARLDSHLSTLVEQDDLHPIKNLQ